MAASSSSPPALCLVRGSLGIDEFFVVEDIVRPGQTISSSSYDRRPGGKGANQAVALAKAGARSRLSGSIGADGHWMLSFLREAGVDVDMVVEVPDAQSGRALIQLSAAGENSIVLYKGTNYALTDPPTPTLFQRSGSITHLMLQNEIPLPSTLSHLHLAHASGVQTIFNPSPLPSVPELLGFPWSELDWLILNESEASDLLSALGESYEAAPAPPTLPRPDGAASMFGAYAVTARLHAHSAFSRTTNIICTLGSIGVLALVPTLALPVYVPAITLPSGALDTTGAGDCFAGYFVAGLMRLHDEGKALDTPALERILVRCVQAAGMCCERRGAMESIPVLEEVEARFAA